MPYFLTLSSRENKHKTAVEIVEFFAALINKEGAMHTNFVKIQVKQTYRLFCNKIFLKAT